MVTSIECALRKRARKFYRACSGCYVKAITIRGRNGEKARLAPMCDCRPQIASDDARDL
jgi:hypothetical protein